MTLLKKVADGMLYKGGMLGTGILGVLLWKGRYLPEYTGVISLCATSVGLCGAVWNIWKAKGKSFTDMVSLFQCKETDQTLYREIVSKLEGRLSQQETATEGMVGRRRNLDRREQGSYRFADDGESSNKRIRLFESPKRESVFSRQAGFLKECAEIFRKNGISKAQECNVGDTTEQAVDASDLSILTDEVDDTEIRESTLKELEILVETGKVPKDLFKKDWGVEDTSDDCKGEVLQASQLFKDWDTHRPGIEKELAALVWRGKGMSLGKTTKRCKL